MARKQITINDGSGERVTNELKLNPLNLTPTITNGGQYNVRTQATPKTTSAMQLAQGLKQGVQAYGEIVGINQKKAANDVMNLSDEEWEGKLTEGLDEDARSLFGYTKAYNRALAQKYYAEEIPSKLQEVSQSMFQDYYEYPDVGSFEAALAEKTSAVYAEADGLLGRNAFGSEANNVLKNATKSDFMLKERAKFLQELPRRNMQLAQETIGRSVDKITSESLATGDLGASTTDLYNSHVETLGKRGAAVAVFSSYQQKIDTLITSTATQDHELAQELIDDLTSSNPILVAGQPLFATAANKAALTDLEARLDRKQATAYDDAVNNMKPHILAVRAQLSGIADVTELEGQIDSHITAIEAGEEVLGKTYENDIEKNLVILELNQAKNNMPLFREQSKLQYIQMNNTSSRTLDSWFTDQMPEAFITRGAMPGDKPTLTSLGYKAKTAYDTFKAEQYSRISLDVEKIADPEQRRLAFIQKEKDEVVPAIKDWFKDYTASAEVTRQMEKDVEDTDERRVLTTAYGEQGAAEILELGPKEREAAFADANEKLTDETLNSKGMAKGRTFPTRLENLIKARKNKLYDNRESQIEDTTSISKDFHGSQRRNVILRMLQPTEGGYFERLGKANEFGDILRNIGLSSAELASGKIVSTPTTIYSALSGMSRRGRDNSVSIQSLFNLSGNNLGTIPILIDGDMGKTIELVQAYMDDPSEENVEAVYATDLVKIAVTHGMDPDKLVQLQYELFKEKGLLK